MVLNKHGSFYMRRGWGTKIQQAVNVDNTIFAPINEQEAIDELGIGRVMIKALRYWSDAMGLTIEEKAAGTIKKVKTSLFECVEKYDPYFQRTGTLALLHRNMANNIDETTAWYWLFNECNKEKITHDEFVDGLHAFVAVNGMKIKRDAVAKEFNCVKNTYVGEENVSGKDIMDEDSYPFLAPLRMLSYDKGVLRKNHLTAREISVELLIYSIAQDNKAASANKGQINIEQLIDGKKQVGKYYNIRQNELMDMLLMAENKGYIGLNNNFGNRYIEFNETLYDDLLLKYYIG